MNNVPSLSAEAQLALQRSQGRDLALKLLLHDGLYSSFDSKDIVGTFAERYIRNASIGTYDCYCTACKQETPFIVSTWEIQHSGGGLSENNKLRDPPSVFALRSVCQRDYTTYLYTFRKIENLVIKIGQHPSMGDISFSELKEVQKGLDPVDRKELGTALGLYSHDAVSGAFVYLRRVFERMIARAHERQTERGNPVSNFNDLRVHEKIDALKDELPERLVKHSAVFSVLSAGIHEISDEKCKEMFPVVKAVIFQMLEQEEHKRRKAVAERESDAAFAVLLSSEDFRKSR